MNMPQGLYLTAAAATTGVLVGAYGLYYVYNEAEKRKLPTTWKEVGTLKDIYLYPIKSCGPVQKDRAECTLLGLKDGWLRDRVLMIVDYENNLITATAYPELLSVRSSITNSILTIQHDDMEIFNLDLSEVETCQSIQTGTVWGVEVVAYCCGFDVSEWFSRLLEQKPYGFRLVLCVPTKSSKLKRMTRKLYTFAKKDKGLFADEVPFNLINEASLNDLNTKLYDDKVCYKNFRPNFLITGAKPYEEDDWKFVKIGNNIFEVIKPCTRFVMTMVNPDTGGRDTKSELLQTLKKHRQVTDPEGRGLAGDSPPMGLQMALRFGTGGQVSINDRIYVA